MPLHPSHSHPGSHKSPRTTHPAQAIDPPAPAFSDSVDDDIDDADICPVCDGKCTCDTVRPQADGSRYHRHISHSPSHPTQPLKIRLTVPATMLNKHQPSPSTSKQPDAHHSSHPYDRHPSELVDHPPSQIARERKPTRRKGRAPKNAPSKSHQHQPTPSTRPPFFRPSTRKSTKQQQQSNPQSYPANRPQRSVYPTFLPASAISTVSSDSSDGSDSLSSLTSSDVDSDDSMEQEEEQFIRAEEDRTAFDKARVRRELLGDGQESKRKRFRNGGWTSHSRREPVSSPGNHSEDGPTHAPEDDEADEADEEEVGEDEEDETDGESSTGNYVGFATGWSDDEESSFDADVFFAGLSDDDSSDDARNTVEEDVQSDELLVLPKFGPLRRDSSNSSLHSVMHAEFEVAESWDGQIVFTNGVKQTRLPHYHLNSTIQPHQEDIPPPSDVSPTSEGGEDDGADIFSMLESDGETTEEELVGADGLPTESAMQLFCLPSLLSSFTTQMPHGHELTLNLLTENNMNKSNCPPKRNRHRTPVLEHGYPPRKPPGPSMGGFQHNIQTHPAHIVIDTATAKDCIPRPYPSLPHVLLNHALSSIPSMEGDSSMRSSSPIVSSLELRSDEIDLDLDDFLNTTTCSDSDSARVDSAFAPSANAQSHRLDQNLHRWDLISIGTFRTRDATSFHFPPSPSKTDGGAVEKKMNDSPTPLQAPKINNAVSPSPSTFASILTEGTPEREPKPKILHQNHPREPRKLKKLKYRNVHHHYHRHPHHPNMKKRGTISIQRTFSATSISTQP